MNLIQANYNNQIHEQFHSCLNCCFYNVASCMVALKGVAGMAGCDL